MDESSKLKKGPTKKIIIRNIELFILANTTVLTTQNRTIDIQLRLV